VCRRCMLEKDPNSMWHPARRECVCKPGFKVMFEGLLH
jgi:hypothetical protein